MPAAAAAKAVAGGGLKGMLGNLPLYVLLYLGMDIAKDLLKGSRQEKLLEKQMEVTKGAQAKQRQARGMLLKKTGEKVRRTKQMQPLDALMQGMMAGMLPSPEAQGQLAAQAMAPVGGMQQGSPIDYGAPITLSSLFG